MPNRAQRGASRNVGSLGTSGNEPDKAGSMTQTDGPPAGGKPRAADPIRRWTRGQMSPLGMSAGPGPGRGCPVWQCQKFYRE
eukprot:6505531-Pyramimonas_sp.AAC.1